MGLPQGFVLDQQAPKLPPGFVVDQPDQVTPQGNQEDSFPGLGRATGISAYKPSLLERVIGFDNYSKLLSAKETLFNNPNTNVPFKNVNPNPQTVGQGLISGGENLVNSLMQPGSVALMAIGVPPAVGPTLPTLGNVGRLAYGTGLTSSLVVPPVAQALGVLSPGSGATIPQKAEASVLPLSLVAGIAAAKGYKMGYGNANQPVVPEWMKAQPQRELTLDERNARANFIKEQQPKQQDWPRPIFPVAPVSPSTATAPVVPSQPTVPLSPTPKVAGATAPLNPGGPSSALAPVLQAIEAANKAKQQQIAAEFKAKLQGQQSAVPQAMNPVMENLARKVADPSAGRLSMPENKFLSQLVQQNPQLHQQFLARVAQIKEQNAIQPSNAQLHGGLRPRNEAEQVGTQVPAIEQSKAVSVGGSQGQVQGLPTQEKIQAAPQAQVSGAVGGALRPGVRSDGQGGGEVSTEVKGKNKLPSNIKGTTTSSLFKQLGINPKVGNVPFERLTLGQLQEKRKVLQMVFRNQMKQLHPDVNPHEAETARNVIAARNELEARLVKQMARAKTSQGVVVKGSVQKPDITGSIFPKLDKVSGEPKTLSQIREGQVTQLDRTVQHLGELRNKVVNSIRTSVPKEAIVRLKDAADNQAKIVAKQASNGIKVRAKELFGEQTPSALNAVTAAIEAKGNKANLDKFIQIATEKKDSRGLAAATFAKQNWDKLQPLVDEINQQHAQELAKEQAIGLPVGEQEGYIRHLYDLSKIPSSLVNDFLAAGQGTSRGFMRGRVFGNLYDAINGGYGKAIKSWNAADLVENRLRSGLQMVNDNAWLEGLRDVKDPSTKRPIVESMVKRVSPVNGKTDLVPPPGYETWAPFQGSRSFAVHRGYRNLLESITKTSAIAQAEVKGVPVGKITLASAGTIKHSMLLFDTFHMVRMMAKGASLGTFSSRKGLSLLEYAPKDIEVALKAGEIDQATFDYLKSNEVDAQHLIKNGLNVGRVQEGLNSEIIRQLPIAGDFNKWVFEKLTRGIMMDSALREYRRFKTGGLSDQEATKKAVTYINTYFGNLGRQGVFRSKTFQDLARLVFLAPQWVESMARTEAGTIGQIPGALASPVTKKPIGTLVKGTSGLVAAMFVATQIANMASRGKPTWENPEEEHKFDAWVPGGQNGFWVSPLSLPMELTHDVIRYTEKGDSPLTAASQIVENKLSPMGRALEVMKTGRDYTGQVLSDKQRVGTAALNLLPVPLPAQPLIKGGYPGQVERQMMASFGIKAEPASSPKAITDRLRRQFLFNIGKAGQPEPSSQFVPIVRALEDNNIEAAKKVYQELYQKKLEEHKFDPDPEHETIMDFQRYFKYYPHYRANATEPQEEAFVKTLTYHQKELYDKAKATEQQVSDSFFNQIQPMVDTNKPRGFRPPTFRKARGFSNQF